MPVHELRTVRSFCRTCTAVCGILVDVSGDEIVRVRGAYSEFVRGKLRYNPTHKLDVLASAFLLAGQQLELLFAPQSCNPTPAFASCVREARNGS